MNRRLIALLLALVVGVQAPLVAYASAVANTAAGACGTATGSLAAPAGAGSHAKSDSCCPGGAPAAGCCLTLCLVSVGATDSPVLVPSYDRADPPLRAGLLQFSSRGDTPLIRPPIR